MKNLRSSCLVDEEREKRRNSNPLHFHNVTRFLSLPPFTDCLLCVFLVCHSSSFFLSFGKKTSCVSWYLTRKLFPPDDLMFVLRRVNAEKYLFHNQSLVAIQYMICNNFSSAINRTYDREKKSCHCSSLSPFPAAIADRRKVKKKTLPEITSVRFFLPVCQLVGFAV